MQCFEALSLWVESERQRLELLAAIKEGRTSLTQGGGRVITEESMRELASEVKARGRARLLSELSSQK